MNTTEPPVRPSATLQDVTFGVQQSRRLLIDTIRALADFSDGITVVGAHAVHVWVQNALGPVPMQATRDADIAMMHTSAVLSHCAGVE